LLGKLKAGYPGTNWKGGAAVFGCFDGEALGVGTRCANDVLVDPSRVVNHSPVLSI
jgi:hypothetical protein